MVRSKDVAPTVVGALGFPIPAEFEGVDLAGVVEGRVAFPAFALSQVDGGGTSVRTPRWKWFRKRLYDLENDPGETRDVSRELPEREAELRRLRDRLVGRDAPPVGEKIEIDAALREQLRSLGYVE
jgi:arylsulfatase A-like enzyme